MIPLERLVIETDSPYQYYSDLVKDAGWDKFSRKGKFCNKNFTEEMWYENDYCEPRHMQLMIERLSKILKREPKDLAEKLFENALRCFRLFKKK